VGLVTLTAPDAPARQPWADAPDEVLTALGSSAAGLTGDEAARRLAEVGPNRLPEPEREGPVKRFLRHFDDILIYILLASAVLKAVLGEWVDFWVILAVAVINAVIGFVQEGRAEDALAGLKQMLSSNAQVRRDGGWQEVDADQLVPGDVVRLRSGDKVPADMRLLEAVNLRVEESALTGEAVPAAKRIDPVEADAGVGDRDSMVFSGTLVAAGSGRGVVTATGPNAEIGRIQAMIAEVEAFDTPLTKEIAAFGKVLSLVILGMAAVMIVIGRVVHDFSTPDLVSAAIGFAVAAIPEGMPALVTITLALGVQQMARRNAITRRLSAVETLGSVTTICSDKTGTLTKNEMTVRHVVTRRGTYDVDGLGYEPIGSVRLDDAPADLIGHPDLARVVTVMAVANDAKLVRDGELWRLIGEPTEGALRTLGRKAGVDETAFQRAAEVPFESDHKYSAVLARPHGDGSVFDGDVVLLKGAPDRLLDRSDSEGTADGATQPLDRAFWEEQVDRLSDQGLRVLAAAARPGAGVDAASFDHDSVAQGMVFLGLAGIVDPPRPEAIDAIAACHEAGIDVKMITGDHAGTAAAIGREMGLTRDQSRPVVTGAELEQASTTQLRAMVREVDVFARTSPEHKLRIVKALQANGDVVAMTGDGVNDAPALKRAEVGVAMGIKGTEATKDAAEIVLADDNFASIEYAVEEGRRIYDNLRKSVAFLLPTNGAQSLVILVAVLFGFTLPLQPTQILWINMVTAVTLSLTLAAEPAEPDIMQRSPRPSGGSLIDSSMLRLVAVVSVLIAGATLLSFTYARNQGLSLAESQTMAVNTLALAQAAYLFNARYLRQSSLRVATFGTNKVMWIGVGVMLLLQVLFVYAPFMHTWFGSAPVGWAGWAVPLGWAVAIFFLVEAYKALAERRARGS